MQQKTKYIFLALSIFIIQGSVCQNITPGGIYQPYAQLLAIKNHNEVEISRCINYFQDSLKWNKWNGVFKPSQNKNFYIKFFDPEVAVYFNSARPYGFNDGPLWKGKGLTTATNVGFSGKIGILHFSFIPSLFLSQNADFELAPHKRTAYSIYNQQFVTGGSIDFVQQYGPSSFSQFNWGQSEVRLIWKKATIAASTSNFKIGPSRVNPILMSYNAGGFPHIELGTIQPVDLSIKSIDLGSVYANLYYGDLKESAYFDKNPNNNHRYFTALSLSYLVPYFKGLKLGANRVFYENTENFQNKDLTRTLLYFSDRDNIAQSNGTALNDYFDQMASVSAEWSFFPIDLRAYIEFAKNDFNGSFRNLIVDFDHARGFTFGLEKAYSINNGDDFLVNIEHTNISLSKSHQYRPTPPYYAHGVVKQGYTNDGQILGAGIGTGGTSNYLSFHWFRQQSMLGLFVQRIQIDDDYYIKNVTDPITEKKLSKKDLRQSELSLGISGLKKISQFSIAVDLTISKRYNMYYEFKNDQTNLYIGVTGKYHINK
jgi:hypothetical protein